MDYNDITIAFSGYNIKNLALLSIESFLKFYPNMRSQIIYFDDESTDGTKEELKKRGIKVITWDENLLNEYNSLINTHKNFKQTQILSIKVSYILEQIIRNTQTTYLMLNDGDVMFDKDNIIEESINDLKENDILYCRNILIGDNQQTELFKYMEESYPELIEETQFCTWRMPHYHIYLNVKKLKENNITSDLLSIEVFEKMEGGIFDTFTNFTKRVLNSPLKRKEKNLDSEVIHFGGVSCSKRGFIYGYSDENDIHIHHHNNKTHNNLEINEKEPFVIINFNENTESFKLQTNKIKWFLHNFYYLDEIYENKKKNLFKITFKKYDVKTINKINN